MIREHFTSKHHKKSKGGHSKDDSIADNKLVRPIREANSKKGKIIRDIDVGDDDDSDEDDDEEDDDDEEEDEENKNGLDEVDVELSDDNDIYTEFKPGKKDKKHKSKAQKKKKKQKSKKALDSEDDEDFMNEDDDDESDEEKAIKKVKKSKHKNSYKEETDDDDEDEKTDEEDSESDAVKKNSRHDSKYLERRSYRRNLIDNGVTKHSSVRSVGKLDQSDEDFWKDLEKSADQRGEDAEDLADYDAEDTYDRASSRWSRRRERSEEDDEETIPKRRRGRHSRDEDDEDEDEVIAFRIHKDETTIRETDAPGRKRKGSSPHDLYNHKVVYDKAMFDGPMRAYHGLNY